MREPGSVAALFVFLSGVFNASSAEPSLKHLYPVAGGQGSTVSVTATGAFNPWPVKAWVDAAGITFKPGDKPGKFDVEIAADAPLGPHFVRFHNESGASAPRFFIVAPQADLAEAEPNDDFHAPQKIAALPVIISGKLDKSGDVDSFAVSLKAGQPLTAWLEAYVLGSAFDGMLRVLDEHGTQLAFNHDGRTLDPVLAWQAPRDGTYIVQVMGFVYPATADVRLTGGDGCVYRLHLENAAPSAPLADAKGTPEKEPNDTLAQAQPLELPAKILARIDRPRDEDRFTFTAAKQHIYELKVVAAAAGSPMDGWLKIEGKDGKELVRSDDVNVSRDPSLLWTAPADGAYTVAVGDVTHHGGPEFTYLLSVAEAMPSVSGTVAASALKIEAGKPAELKVSVKRTAGFKAKLKLAALGLPEGVTTTEVDVPDKDGEVTLKFTAAAEAAAASQPFRLVLREPEGGHETPVRFFLTTSSEDNGVPQGYTDLVIDSLDQLWLTLTVPPPPPAPKPAAVAEPAAEK